MFKEVIVYEFYAGCASSVDIGRMDNPYIHRSEVIVAMSCPGDILRSLKSVAKAKAKKLKRNSILYTQASEQFLDAGRSKGTLLAILYNRSKIPLKELE